MAFFFTREKVGEKQDFSIMHQKPVRFWLLKSRLDGTVVIAISPFPVTPSLILEPSKRKVFPHWNKLPNKINKSWYLLVKRLLIRVAIDCAIWNLDWAAKKLHFTIWKHVSTKLNPTSHKENLLRSFQVSIEETLRSWRLNFPLLQCFISQIFAFKAQLLLFVQLVKFLAAQPKLVLAQWIATLF